jgi:hypothetical protein
MDMLRTLILESCLDGKECSQRGRRCGQVAREDRRKQVSWSHAIGIDLSAKGTSCVRMAGCPRIRTCGEVRDIFMSGGSRIAVTTKAK